MGEDHRNTVNIIEFNNYMTIILKSKFMQIKP